MARTRYAPRPGRTDEGAPRPLKPVGSNRFVVPDAYVPAGTAERANRDATGTAHSLTVIAGDGALVFDKRPQQG